MKKLEILSFLRSLTYEVMQIYKVSILYTVNLLGNTGQVQILFKSGDFLQSYVS